MNHVGRPLRLGFTDALVMKAMKERLNAHDESRLGAPSIIRAW